MSFAARKTTYRMGTSIPVILLDAVTNLGQKGNLVNVKRGSVSLTHTPCYLLTYDLSLGYARNLLIPKKLAIYATEANRNQFQIPTPKRKKQ